MGNLRVALIFSILLFSSLPLTHAETPTIVWEKDIPRMTMFSISPNGEYIAIASTIELNGKKDKISFYDKSGDLLWEYEETGIVSGLDVANDGKVIVGTELSAVNYKPKIKVLDKNGDVVWEKETKGITKVAISHDGRSSVAYGNINEKTDIHSFNSLGARRSYSARHSILVEPLALGISSDGQRVIVGSSVEYGEFATLQVYEPGGDYFEEKWLGAPMDITEVSIDSYGGYAAAIQFSSGYINKLFFLDSVSGVIDFEKTIKEGIFDVLVAADSSKMILGGRSNVYEYDNSGALLNTYETSKVVPTSGSGEVKISVTEGGTYLVADRDNKLYFLSGPELMTETPTTVTASPPETEAPETTSPPATTSSPQTTEPPMMESVDEETTAVDAELEKQKLENERLRLELEKAKLEQEQSKGACGPSAIILLAMLPLLSIRRWGK